MDQWKKVKDFILDDIKDSNTVFPHLDTLHVTFDDLSAMPMTEPEAYGEVMLDLNEFMSARENVDAQFTTTDPRDIFLQLRKRVLEESRAA